MKNMALSDLVLVRPRSFPHPESVALAAGADDILTNARVVDNVAAAIADCAFIAGTTSPEVVLLGVHDAARCRRPHRRNGAGKPGGAVVRVGALRAGDRGFESLQCAGAHSR